MIETQTIAVAPVRVDVAGAEALLLRDITAMISGLRSGSTRSPTQTMLDRARIAVYHESAVVTYELLGTGDDV